MGPSASPPATRSPSSRMRARGRATSSRSPRSSGPASSTGSACGSRPSRSSGGSRRSCEPGDARGAGVSGILSALLIALAACATTTMSVSPTDRWRADLDAYRTRRGALAAEVRQVTDDFQALGAESSFPGLEDKIATLAARVRRGEEPDDEQTLMRSLWSLSLGELVLFQRLPGAVEPPRRAGGGSRRARGRQARSLAPPAHARPHRRARRGTARASCAAAVHLRVL